MKKLRLLPILLLCFLLGGCSVTDIMLALYKNVQLSQQLENPQQEDDEYVRAYVNVAVEVAIRDFQMAGYRIQTESMKYYYQETLEEVYGCEPILTQFILGKLNNTQTPALSTEGTYIDIDICTDSNGEAIVTAKLNREADEPKMPSTEVIKTPIPTSIPLGTIAIDEAHFTSEVFRAYILEHFDTDKDGILSVEERRAITSIDISPYDEPRYDFSTETVDGLEYFPFLSSFITEVRIHTLIIDGHPSLETIDYYAAWDGEEDGSYNNLYIKNCPNLKEVSAWLENNITVSDCEQLEIIWLSADGYQMPYGEWVFSNLPKAAISVGGKLYGLTPERQGTLQLDASTVLKNRSGFEDCNFDEEDLMKEDYVLADKEAGFFWIKKFGFSGQDAATLWNNVEIQWTNRSEDSFLPTEEYVVPLLKEAMEQSYRFDIREMSTGITEKDGKKGYFVVSSYSESGYHTNSVPIYTGKTPLPEHFFVRVTDVTEYFPIEYAPNLGAVVRAKFLTEFVYTENSSETVIDKIEKEVYALVKTDQSVTFYTEYSDVKGWDLKDAEEERLFPTAEVLKTWLETYDFNTLYQFGFKEMTLGETMRDGMQGYYVTVAEAETGKEFLSYLSFPVIYSETVPDTKACSAQFGYLNDYKSVHYSTGIGHVLKANIVIKFIYQQEDGERADVERNFLFPITVASDGTLSLYLNDKSLPEEFQITSAENRY